MTTPSEDDRRDAYRAADPELYAEHVASDDGMPHPKDHEAQSAVESWTVDEAKLAQTRAMERESLRKPQSDRLSNEELWASLSGFDPIANVAREVVYELRKANGKHGRGSIAPGRGDAAHACYGVLLEEVDELWDEVKAQNFDRDKARKEAIQVAAMAIRFVLNVCDRYPEGAARGSYAVPEPAVEHKPETTIYTGR